MTSLLKPKVLQPRAVPKAPDPIRIPKRDDPDVRLGQIRKTQEEFRKRKGRESTNLTGSSAYNRTALG